MHSEVSELMRCEDWFPGTWLPPEGPTLGFFFRLRLPTGNIPGDLHDSLIALIRVNTCVVQL